MKISVVRTLEQHGTNNAADTLGHSCGCMARIITSKMAMACNGLYWP